MSSSTLCQGLQSCLEPKSLEPHVLVQNLSPDQKPSQKNHEILHIDTTKNKESAEPSFWSCLGTQNSSKQDYGYSSPILSPKSLEMCTESLGSETGSSIGESIEDFYLPSSPEGFQLQPWRLRESQKKIFRSGSFPPPLTSISGSDGVQVSSYREDGRLVLRAVSVGSCSSFFQTERSNGRLKLSLYKSPDSDVEAVDEEDEDEDLGMDNGENEHVGFEDFPRLATRCKEEGGNRNKRWEPFWVAIS